MPLGRIPDCEWLSDDYWKRVDDELMVDITIQGMEQHNDTNYYW